MNPSVIFYVSGLTQTKKKIRQKTCQKFNRKSANSNFDLYLTTWFTSQLDALKISQQKTGNSFDIENRKR